MPAVLWGVVPEGQGQDMSQVIGASSPTQAVHSPACFKACCICGSCFTSLRSLCKGEAASVKAAICSPVL